VIGDDGCIALCKGLQGHPALTTLNIDRCSLHQDGAKALADMLTRNCVLKTLHAAGNCMPHDGVSHIATALKVVSVDCYL
jgi:Leucine Rich repeat